jgi:hypothetical protein
MLLFEFPALFINFLLQKYFSLCRQIFGLRSLLDLKIFHRHPIKPNQMLAVFTFLITSNQTTRITTNPQAICSDFSTATRIFQEAEHLWSHFTDHANAFKAVELYKQSADAGYWPA